MICLINVTIHKINVHLPLFNFTFCWLIVQGISICTRPRGEIRPSMLHHVLRHGLCSEVIVVICYCFPIKTSLWDDNWDCGYELGKAGRRGDTISFHLSWSRCTGQREHILIWTGTLSRHYMPLYVMPVSIISVWYYLH